MVRVLILSVALISAAGCAERRFLNVTPDRPDRTATSGAPADSLSAYMAKFREISANARPEGRPAVRTVEASDPALAAALLAATAVPSPVQEAPPTTILPSAWMATALASSRL